MKSIGIWESVTYSEIMSESHQNSTLKLSQQSCGLEVKYGNLFVGLYAHFSDFLLHGKITCHYLFSL